MPRLRIALFALAALLGSALTAGTASAMPANGLAVAENQNAGTAVQEVRWVCGPFRCWWRPQPYWGGPYWGWRRHYWGGPYWGWRRHHWGRW